MKDLLETVGFWCRERIRYRLSEMAYQMEHPVIAAWKFPYGIDIQLTEEPSTFVATNKHGKESHAPSALDMLHRISAIYQVDESMSATDAYNLVCSVDLREAEDDLPF